MLIVANPNSIPSRQAPNFMLHYTNTLGLNTTWQFFSPNPMGERYLEYTIYSASNKEDFSDHHWPPRAKIRQEKKNRLFTHSLYSTANEQHTRDVFIPWLCRKHPTAFSIFLQAKTKSLPSIEVAQIDKKKFKFLSKSHDLPLKEYLCP